MLRAAESVVRNREGQVLAIVMLLTDDVRKENVAVLLLRSLTMGSLIAIIMGALLTAMLAVWCGRVFNQQIKPIRDDLKRLSGGNTSSGFDRTKHASEPILNADFASHVRRTLTELDAARQKLQHILGRQ